MLQVGLLTFPPWRLVLGILHQRVAALPDDASDDGTEPRLNVHQTRLPTLILRSVVQQSCDRFILATARTLGWTIQHPPSVVREENTTTRQGRPLVEVEFDTIRSIASVKRHTRHAAAVAIAFSGGGTADIAGTTRAHVDLEDGTITLPGGRHIAERTVRIPGEWEYDILTERLADLDKLGRPDDDGLVVRRQGSAASRQAGAAIAITEVLQEGQLRSDPTIKPASISRWAALVAFETSGDIAAAASLLGTGSLDTAAAAIGWDWTNSPAVMNDARPDYRPGVVA